MEKRCSTCGVTYQNIEGNFNRNGTSAAGTNLYRSSCKQCESLRVAKYRSPLDVQRQAEARRRARNLQKVREHLTEVVRCSKCNKSFLVTVLPEKAHIILTCHNCAGETSKEI